jgi:hypothetical protein
MFLGAPPRSVHPFHPPAAVSPEDGIRHGGILGRQHTREQRRSPPGPIFSTNPAVEGMPMGRRPIGRKAMTPTEYQQRWRAKKKAARAQTPHISGGNGSTPPESITKAIACYEAYAVFKATHLNS